MFRRTPQKRSGANEPFTYIHQDTTITGDLVASGRVRVHGTVRGNVTVDGVLEIAEAGVIEGEQVRADEVKIIGRVHANVEAKGKIEIWRKGRLVGDVRASALDIEEGASFSGRSLMSTAGAPAELPGEVAEPGRDEPAFDAEPVGPAEPLTEDDEAGVRS